MTAAPLAELPGRPCPIAAALELVGERWALLVVREIALGSTRFSDIVAGTGAPRDRIAAAAYAMFDTDRNTVAHHRVPYDAASAAAKIRATDLPDVLAARILQGY